MHSQRHVMSERSGERKERERREKGVYLFQPPMPNKRTFMRQPKMTGQLGLHDGRYLARVGVGHTHDDDGL